MKNFLSKPLLIGAVAVIGALALPRAVASPYYIHLFTLALIWIVLAQGQNLTQGFVGYVSIAQAGFMGIGAEGEGLLEVGRGEGIVDDQLGAGSMGDFGDGRDVSDVEQRVGGCLDPDRLGRRCHGGLDRVQVVDSSGRVGQSPLAENLVDQPERAAIGVIGNHQVVAGPQHRAQGAVCRRHAGAEGTSV